jgi:hypothetical protein
VPLAGETEQVLRFPGTLSSHNGQVAVMVSDALGTTTSDSAALSVLIKPVLVHEPDDQTVRAGGSVSFAVEATGFAPLRYHWLRNQSFLDNQTNAVLVLSNVQAAEAGSYAVWVHHTGPTGDAAIVSRAARLDVLP